MGIDEQPVGPMGDQEDSETPRRSTRERHEPARLVIKSFKGKTYDDMASKSVALSLTSCWPRGGGGINDVCSVLTSLEQDTL